MRCIDAVVITLLFVICVIMACYIAMQAAPGKVAASASVNGGRGAASGHKKMRLRFPRHVVEYGAPDIARDVDYASLEMAPADSKGHSPTIYSSLMPWHVAGAKRVLLEELAGAPPATILDAAAHVGVDSTLLLSLFPKANLTAVEIDPATAAVTARNLARAGPRASVTVGDGAARVAAGPPTDLLYLDPPWGGVGAAARAAAPVLSLGGVPLPSLVATALDAGYGRVAVKLPRDTDTAAFVAAVAAAVNAADAASSDKITARIRPVCDARRPADCETHPGYWLAFFTK